MRILRSTVSISALTLFLAIAMTIPIRASSVEWARFPEGCSTGTSTLEVSCGPLGDYHFGTILNFPGCDPIDGGTDDPPVYPQPYFVMEFPHPPSWLMGATPPTESSARAYSNSVATLGTGLGQRHDWLAIVDYDTSHGWSTSFLADSVAGPRVDTLFSRLDDPDWGVLGTEVTDFHVLAALCRVVARTDASDLQSPLGVNMSFGRAIQPHELGLNASCSDGTAACEIAKVVAELRTQGATVTAAAGNYDDILFPAGIFDVLPVGMIDTNSLLEPIVSTPLWETPAEATAFAPGGSLCLEGIALPSGSSFSSAILAGWLAKLHRRYDFDPLDGGHWYPYWNEPLGCYVLSDGIRRFDLCNAGFSALIEGLDSTYQDTCWSAIQTPAESTQQQAPAESQPNVPSFDAWSSTTHPTPEGDPCVPCVGTILSVGQDTDLEIDFSQSLPVGHSVFLDSVYLRLDTSFYPLNLDATQLSMIENATLASLTLAGWSWSWPATSQPSLFFVMKPYSWMDCETSSGCYFMSTGILLKSPPI